jgi:two-component system invasion response regulator UvrY
MKRLLIADPHEVVWEGLKSFLPSLSVSKAVSLSEAVGLVREQDWDAIILCLPFGERTGLEALKELKRIRPNLPILVLSGHPQELYARRAFRAGASGYINKDTTQQELVRAVHTVIGGGRFVTLSLAERLAGDLQPDSEKPLHVELSDREYEILTLIASGKTVREIAGLLSISNKTVAACRAKILRKLNINTPGELIYYAVQNKLID